MVARVVRLMNEYTVRWPLWGQLGPLSEGELKVSDPVARELKAWARSFNEHFDWQRGWDDPAIAAAHALEATRLRDALQADLGPQYDVVLDLWEAPLP